MFESVVSQLTSTVRNVVRSVGAATRKSPWMPPVAILVLFLFV